MQLKPNTLLQGGKYRIEKFLGQGGFGITYQAVQVALNRKVAIKEFFMKEYCERDGSTSHVSLGTSGSRETVERFRQKFIKEAQTIACLNHPHIIRIHDVFEENGTAYYVMEYWDNGSLADLVKSRGKLSETEALKYIRQVADALSYIHQRKMNHLDVKPGNILLDEKQNAVLIDFGLSKRYDAEGNQTSTTPVGISHGYAPLEQYKKGGVGTFSPATDIYSLGATLYKLLTGKTPPEANDVMEDGFATFPNGVSVGMATLIERAMQPNRNKRLQDVEEFLWQVKMLIETDEEELEGGEEDETVVVVDASSADSLSSQEFVEEVPAKPLQKRRIPWKKGLLIASVLLLVIFAGYYWKNTDYMRLDLTTPGTAVDLGLSVKWADCNVGASSPSDYGGYFAWGEISQKFTYYESNSETFEVPLGDISGNSRYDAARANWGGNWRLPTKAECQELVDKCTWTWTTQGGHNGYKVVGPNGNSIFLPAAGLRDGASLDDAGGCGYYWNSTPDGIDTQHAYRLYFHCYYRSVHGSSRNYGRSVRPVSE